MFVSGNFSSSCKVQDHKPDKPAFVSLGKFVRSERVFNGFKDFLRLTSNGIILCIEFSFKTYK